MAWVAPGGGATHPVRPHDQPREGPLFQRFSPDVGVDRGPGSGRTVSVQNTVQSAHPPRPNGKESCNESGQPDKVSSSRTDSE